jgi:hypothetical protein
MRVNRSQRQGSGREAVAERSPRQSPDHRNTKRQRGRMRAASVLGNAKPKSHQDASGRAAWPGMRVHVLTQGDLTRESGPGVSRGRSSDEAVRKHGGAKGRRNDCKATREPVKLAKRAPTSAAQVDGLHETLHEPQAPDGTASQAPRRGNSRSTCGTQGTGQ